MGDAKEKEFMQIDNRAELPLLLNRLSLTGTGAEIGVQIGLYSEEILKKSRLKLLYSIDCWKNFDKKSYIDIANKSQLKHYYYYLKTVFRLMKFKKRSYILRKTSQDAAAKFKNECLDFIYIDARHSYEGCKEDIVSWWPKLKKGGIFAGHDYLNGVLKEGDFGVKKAVDEFIKDKKLKLFTTNEEWPTWYLMKR